MSKDLSNKSTFFSRFLLLFFFLEKSSLKSVEEVLPLLIRRDKMPLTNAFARDPNRGGATHRQQRRGQNAGVGNKGGRVGKMTSSYIPG